MRLSSISCGLALGVALVSSARASRADNYEDQDEYPLQFAQRPLTLNAQSLSPVVSLDVTRLVHDPNDVQRVLETNVTLQVGAAYGITRYFEVSASLAQLQILPTVAYGNPTFGATFSFVHTAFELGARAELTIVTASATAGAIVEPSLPARVHLGESARLDFGVGLPIARLKGSDTQVGLDLPLSLAFNLAEALHIGARTSVFIPDLNNPTTTLAIPLGFFAGLSFGSDHPVVEFDPYFTWPKFAQPGATNFGSQKFNIDLYTAGVAIRGFLYF